MSVERRLLRVTGDGWVAGAEYEKVNGKWICRSAAPKLKWLKTTQPGAAKAIIERNNWKWEWL